MRFYLNMHGSLDLNLARKSVFQYNSFMLISNLEIEVNFLNKVKTLLLLNLLYARGHGFQTDSRGLICAQFIFWE